MRIFRLTHLLLLNVSFLSIVACEKDGVNETGGNEETTVTTNEYFPVSVGSYWIYEFESLDQNGNNVGNVSVDTLKIIGDTTINGETHFVFNSNMPTTNTQYYRRNNDGRVENQSGILICPPDNSYNGVYNEHYNVSGTDTVHYYWEEFSGYKTITTDFGETHACIQKTIYHQVWPNYGGQLTADTVYYSPIGIIQRSFSYFSGGKNVGKLVDYHLE